MNQTKERILTEAMQLSAADRQELAERLIVSVHEAEDDGLAGMDPEILDEWKQEIRRRMEAYQRGEIETIDGELVFQRLRKKYGS